VISLAHGAAGTFTNADTITGGTGTDTFNITGDIALTITLDTDFQGIEVLNVGQTTAAVSITTFTDNIADAAVLTVTSSQTTGALTFNAAAENGAAGNTGLVSVTGGGGNDVITGTAQADTLSGGNGDDNLTGGTGIDSLLGGDGGDTISGGAGADIINAGLGNNVVDGGLGVDAITFGDGSSILVISDGSPIVDSVASADVVTGFTTGSTATGGDVVRFGIGDLDAGTGTITLTSQAGDINAAAVGLLHTVTPGAAAAATANSNVILITGTTGTALTSALNGASVTGLTAGAEYVVVYYDADLNGGSMVVSAVDPTGGASNTVLDAGDIEFVLMSAAMTTTLFNALIAANFTFG